MTARFVSGFVLGSLITLSVGCYFYLNTNPASFSRYIKKREDEDENETNDNDNNGDDATTPPSFRRQSLSASIASALTRCSDGTSGSSGIRTGLLGDIVRELWVHISKAGSTMIRETVEPMLPSSIELLSCDLGANPMRFDNINVHDISPDKSCLQWNMDIKWDGRCDIGIRAPVVGVFGINRIEFYGRIQIVMKPLGDSIPCIDAIQYAFVNQPYVGLHFHGIAGVANTSYLQDQILTAINDTLASMVVLPHRMVFKMVDDMKYDFLNTYHPPMGVARITLVSGRGFRTEKKTLLQKEDIRDVYCYITMDGTIPAKSKQQWKSKTIPNCLESVWCDDDNNNNDYDEGAMADFVLFDFDQIIKVVAWDEDNSRFDPDDLLGQCQVTVGELILACKNEKERSMELPLLLNDRSDGAFVTLRCELCPLTSDIGNDTEIVVDGSNKGDSSDITKQQQEQQNDNVAQQEDSNNNNNSNSEHCIVGLLTIVALRIHNIMVLRNEKRNQDDKDNDTLMSIFVRAKYAGREFCTSPVNNSDDVDDEVDDYSFNPVYDTVFHVPLNPSRFSGSSNNSSSSGNDANDDGVVFEIVNNGVPTSAADTTDADNKNKNEEEEQEEVLGTILVTNEELWNSENKTITDQRKFGTMGASLEFSIMLQGVDRDNKKKKKNNNTTDDNSNLISDNDDNNTTPITSTDIKSRSTGDDNDGDGIASGGARTSTVTSSDNYDPTEHKVQKQRDSTAAAAATDAITIRSSGVGSRLSSLVHKKVSITIVRGHGFPIEKKSWPQKDDIPDCYCLFQYGSSPQGKWKTSTIKDSCEPVWNETSPTSYTILNLDQVIHLEVWDEDKSMLNNDPDDFLGSETLTIGKLMSLQQEQEKEEVVLELRDQQKNKNGCFLVLSCKVT